MSLVSALKSQFASSGSLSRRAMNAGFWSLGELGVGQAIRLLSNLIMTRILLPEAFGVMAMVTTVIVALKLFTDIGIHRSIVRSPRGEEPYYLQVAWSVQIVRSAAIACCVLAAGIGLWLLAPGLAASGTVYADPQLPFMIMVASLAVIFEGLTSTNQWLAARHLAYARLSLMRIASQVLGLVVMVGLALLFHSVWALLSALLLGTLSNALLSHIVLRGPTMRWIWDREIAEELWHFGKWLIGSSSFTFIQNNADKLILAALLEARVFGFYVIAILWVNVGVMILQKLIGQVGFSGLSEVVQKRPGDLPRVLRKFTRVLDLLSLAAFGALLLGGPLLVELLYPPQYATSARYLPFLAPLLLTIRFQIFGSLAMIHGNSRLMMLGSAISAFALIGLLFIGYRAIGIEGALLAVALSPLASAVVFLRWAARRLDLPIWRDIVWLVAILAVAAALSLTLPI